MTLLECHVGLAASTEAAALAAWFRSIKTKCKGVAATSTGRLHSAELSDHGVEGSLSYITTFVTRDPQELGLYLSLVGSRLVGQSSSRIEVEAVLSPSEIVDPDRDRAFRSCESLFRSCLPSRFTKVSAPRYESHLKFKQCKLAAVQEALDSSLYFELTEFDRDPPEVVLTCASNSLEGILRSTTLATAGAKGAFGKASAPVYEAVVGCWRPA